MHGIFTGNVSNSFQLWKDFGVSGRDSEDSKMIVVH